MDERETMNTRKHSNRSRDTDGQPSIGRRRALEVASGIMVGLSGCLRPGTSASSIGKDTGSVFEGTSFDGPDLVVHLREDHGVSSLNLIGPSGEAHRTVRVRKGETTVRIPILRIEPGRYEHYTPGDHQLIAEIGERIESRSLKLVPELQIVDVKQHSGGNIRDHGNLKVTISNDGTGPTWIYAIDYQNPINYKSDIAASNPGSPELYLKRPDNGLDCIIQPMAEQRYTGAIPPLIYSDPESCNSSKSSYEVIARSPTEDVVKKLTITANGLPSPLNEVSLFPKYVCNEMKIDLS